MNKIDAIRSVDLLSPLSDIDKALLANAARVRIVERGETVCTQGEMGKTFFIVGFGKLSVRVGNPAVDVATLGAGAYLGEMSLLTGAPRTATVVALERCELLELDRPVFNQLFIQNAGLAQLLSDQVAQRMVRLDEARGQADQLRMMREKESVQILGRIRNVFGLKG